MSHMTIRVSEPERMIGNERRYLNDCLDRNQLSLGPYVYKFEALFAETCGVRHAVATTSGTTALHLLLAALNLAPGDEVIVPNLTFVATANAVRYCGATPVFCDVDPFTWTMDPEDMAQRISPRTVGVIPVHLFGHPADMDRINLIAQHHGLWVVEDAAQAIGALYRNRPVGALSDAAMFSFYGNKTITCGEGGMVVTNREDLDKQMRLLRGQGQHPTRRYYHTVVGYNYRMTDLQAAVGLAQLEQLAYMITKRMDVWDLYSKLLSTTVTLLSMGRQHVASWVSHGRWMRVVTFDSPQTRDAVAEALGRDGIETRPMFIPLSLQPPYMNGLRYPVSESLGARGLCLPTHGNLRPEHVQYVCECLIKALETAPARLEPAS